MRHLSYFLIISFLLSFGVAKSQISHGGSPKSFNNEQLNSNFQSIEVFADRSLIPIEDTKRDGEVEPYKIGLNIAANFTPKNSGTWFTLDNGDMVWKLEITSSGAEALSVDFEKFKLPENAELFLYNKTKNQVIGAFTIENNPIHGYFATELIQGDVVIVEYIVPFEEADHIPFIISEVAYIYRDSGFGDFKAGFGTSGSCEININCLEGQDWQKQKKGVLRIYGKRPSGRFYCTGSLINNERNDFTPYFLTANHCGSDATFSDYAQWVFYFNYETEGCDNPASDNEPALVTMTGSTLLAKAANSTSTGSDFKLLLLSEDVPEEYDPYFNGWNRSLLASNSGVGIHHPAGDIKKISHYTSPLESSDYNNTADVPNGNFWRVVWAPTTNGHGVTEGGSSGSPIFNQDGLIVGTLTGGLAGCSNLFGPDYYGKFSYSWISNGDTNDSQLKPWLDPLNTGVESVNGFSYDDIIFIPEFAADTVVVPIGGSLIFTDLSVGFPSQWTWTFEGGIPESSTLQSPPSINYQSLGVFDVSMHITNSLNDEVLLKEDYIKVVPTVGPLPSNDKVTVYLGSTPVSDVIFTLYDGSGRELEKHVPGAPIKHLDLYLSKYSAGYYFLKVETPTAINMHKIVIN